MKLTEDDEKILLEMGCPAEDIPQIRDAALTKYTRYTLYENEKSAGKRIGEKEAIRLLGRKMWLSGLERSAFHCSAARKIEGSEAFILFDSKRLLAV